MEIAYDYPLLGVFWTMLEFFFFVIWIILVFRVLGDIFRNKEMSGVAKAVWLIVLILMPFLGVLIYLIANGSKMAQRAQEAAEARDAAFQSYVRETAGGSGPADELKQLAALRESGVISDEQFEAGKAKILT